MASSQCSTSLPVTGPVVYLYDEEAVQPHERCTATVPIMPADSGAMSSHLREIVKSVSGHGYFIKISQDDLQMVDNREDGTLYVKINLDLANIVPAPNSPEFPVLAFPPANYHISVAYKLHWTTWPDRHRANIRARALLAGSTTRGVFAQFAEWGSRSCGFLLKPNCEMATLVSMVRQEYIGQNMRDLTPEVEAHMSWQL